MIILQMAPSSFLKPCYCINMHVQKVPEMVKGTFRVAENAWDIFAGDLKALLNAQLIFKWLSSTLRICKL